MRHTCIQNEMFKSVVVLGKTVATLLSYHLVHVQCIIFLYTFLIFYSETCLKRTQKPLKRGVYLVQVHFTENKGRKIGLY